MEGNGDEEAAAAAAIASRTEAEKKNAMMSMYSTNIYI